MQGQWMRGRPDAVDSDDQQQSPHNAGRRASADSLSSYESSFREPRYSFAASDSEAEDDDSFSDQGIEGSESGHKTASGMPRRNKIAAGATAVSSTVLIRTVIHPILNILGTAVIIGCLLWYYTERDFWEVTANLGMTPSAVIALLITLVTVLLRSGIEYGISEYKWSRFQFRNVKLIFLDVYHSGSRGMGGVLRVLLFMRHFDWVVIAAAIFYLGLIAIPPAGLQLLQQTPITTNFTCNTVYNSMFDRPDANLLVSNISASDPLLSMVNYVRSSYSALTINGTTELIAVPYGIKSFLRNTTYAYFYYPCPPDADLCSYPNVHFPHTTMDCQPGNLDTAIVNVHTDNRTSLRDYYNVAPDAEHVNVRTPSFHFAGSMWNRTLYNLANVTAPDLTFAGKPAPFDQAVRNGVGPQTFVMVTYQDTLKNMESAGGFSIDDLHIRECTLHTGVNITTMNASSADQSYFIDVHETTPPINIDYDKLGNVSHWSIKEDEMSGSPQTTAYAYQMDIMRALIMDEEGLWDPRGLYQRAMAEQFPTVDEFFRGAFNHVDVVFTLTFASVNGDTDEIHLCTTPRTLFFAIDTVSYIVFALMLVAPLLWWAILWILSMYKMNGASLGASQILLVWSGLLPVLRSTLPSNILQSDQHAIAKAAGELSVRFGQIVQDDDSGISRRLQPAGFGPDEYVQPLHQRMRRKSV